MTERAYAPHCDQRVLHSPGTCTYCDDYPDWQLYRMVLRMNFTGEHNPDWLPCPAEADRPLSQIERWGGNVPEQPRFGDLPDNARWRD